MSEETARPDPDPAREQAPPAAAAAAPPVLDYATGRPSRLVALATFGQPFEAHLAAGKLDTQGIRAVVTGDTLAAIGAPVTGIGGAVRLLVEEDDLARARAALPRRLWAGDQPACPACGSDRVRKADFTGWRGFLDGLLLGLPRLFLLRPKRCEACGHRWVPTVDEDDEAEDGGADQDGPAAEGGGDGGGGGGGGGDADDGDASR